MATVPKETYRSELRAAVRHLNDRCLYSSSRWAAELLVGLDPDSPTPSSVSSSSIHITPSSTSFPSRRRSAAAAGSGLRRHFRSGVSSAELAATPMAGVSYVSTPHPHDDDSEGSSDRCLLAKAHFDCREYRRASHALKGQRSKRAVFLRCYTLYLAGEKRKEEEMIEVEKPLGQNDAVNKELVSLEKELSLLHRNGAIDPFGLYLYGIVLKDKGSEKQAIAVLVESVNSYPWNWSAWSELQSLCTSIDVLNSLNLKNHWVKDFFLASAYQELNMQDEALERYRNLQVVFHGSNNLQAQIATTLYGLRELDDAEMIFEDLLRTDPHRVESMDIFSNLLYAKECLSALSFLAHRVILTDKYRPESCCVVANYYSLKGHHEKSVLYFRRALKLNRKYLSAWTLMGHEFVEMKNCPAAIDAYRKAVDINPKDFRAWYGLGHAYEMLSMPHYALYYFRKSSYLQSNDARIWIGMAQCYESAPLQMLEEAIKCYMRAESCNDMEGIALNHLAKLHKRLGHYDKAAFFYKKDLERMEAENRQGDGVSEALLFLANYCKSEKRLDEAEMYCTKLLDYSGPERDTAKSLLLGLKSPLLGSPSMDIEDFNL